MCDTTMRIVLNRERERRRETNTSVQFKQSVKPFPLIVYVQKLIITDVRFFSLCLFSVQPFSKGKKRQKKSTEVAIRGERELDRQYSSIHIIL